MNEPQIGLRHRWFSVFRSGHVTPGRVGLVILTYESITSAGTLGVDVVNGNRLLVVDTETHTDGW